MRSLRRTSLTLRDVQQGSRRPGGNRRHLSANLGGKRKPRDDLFTSLQESVATKRGRGREREGGEKTFRSHKPPKPEEDANVSNKKKLCTAWGKQKTICKQRDVKSHRH